MAAICSRFISIAQIVLFLLLGIASGSTPTARFNDEIQTTPIVLYQCYRNGTTVEPENSVNYTVLFDGTSPNDTDSKGDVWFAINGTQNSYTQLTFTAKYESQTDMIILVAAGSTTEEKIHLLADPFRGKGYFVNEMFGGKPASKIYDADKTCVNAAANLREACPDGCGMRFVRDIGRVSGGSNSGLTVILEKLCRHYPFLPIICATKREVILS
ncbi:unnamed protein product [Ixodes pacificus]